MLVGQICLLDGLASYAGYRASQLFLDDRLIHPWRAIPHPEPIVYASMSNYEPMCSYIAPHPWLSDPSVHTEDFADEHQLQFALR
jgi:hypothetical protein